ncbi:MAG: hypothetical protein HQP61_02020 [Peptococcaceae bacterium]|nr:hypothetical protein [Candidatus Syntrophopropionicum ammoniitolerans]
MTKIEAMANLEAATKRLQETLGGKYGKLDGRDAMTMLRAVMHTVESATIYLKKH